MLTKRRYDAPPLFVREYRSGRALCLCGCGEPAPLLGFNDATSGAVKGRPQWCLPNHSPRKGKTYTEEQRTAAFWEKVDKRGPGECWPWTGALRSPGYPCFWDGERRLGGHRVSYELHVGPIPTDHTIDHLCRNITCVNPAHLEAVPMRVNNERSNSASAKNARKSYCKRGHAFTAENTFLTDTGGRGCRTCRNMRQREGYARKGPLAPGTVSTGEAAKILGVHSNTLRLWVQAGHITPVDTPHRLMRFDAATLKRPDSLGPYERKSARNPTETSRDE